MIGVKNYLKNTSNVNLINLVHLITKPSLLYPAMVKMGASINDIRSNNALVCELLSKEVSLRSVELKTINIIFGLMKVFIGDGMYNRKFITKRLTPENINEEIESFIDSPLVNEKTNFLVQNIGSGDVAQKQLIFIMFLANTYLENNIETIYEL